MGVWNELFNALMKTFSWGREYAEKTNNRDMLLDIDNLENIILDTAEDIEGVFSLEEAEGVIEEGTEIIEDIIEE